MSFASDAGFAGPTHIVVNLVVGLWLLIAMPAVLLGDLSTSWLTYGLFLLVLAGASVVNDLDHKDTSSRNVKTTAKAALGPLGGPISWLFRQTSYVAQRAFRTKYDEVDPEVHRGLWHTYEGALLLTVIAWIVAPVQLLGVMLGVFYSVLGSYVLIGKIKHTVVQQACSVLVAIVSGYLLYQVALLPWLPIAVGVGAALHTLGDTFTAYGTPGSLLVNTTFRFKIWYYNSFSAMQSGGDAEKRVLFPVALGLLGVSAIIFVLKVAAIL